MENVQNSQGPQTVQTNPPFLVPEEPKKPATPLMGILVVIFFLGASVLLLGETFFLNYGKNIPFLAQSKEPLFLKLESPVDSSIVEENQIIVRGKTLPNTTVVFFNEENQNFSQSDNTGQFEGKLSLIDGINTLTVTAFTAGGEEKTTSLDLVYDYRVKGVKTSPGEPAKEKEEEEESAKADIGGIDKVTENSITIDEKKGKNKIEAEVGKNTQVVGQNKKTLRFDSLKQKDMVAIISTESAAATGGGTFKKALKIFVKEANISAQTKRRAVYGVITNIAGPEITLAHPVQKERTFILLTDKTTIIKVRETANATLADLKVGQRVTAVGSLDNEGLLTAKMIQVIPGKATGLFEKNPGATASVEPTSSPAPSLTPTPTPF